MPKTTYTDEVKRDALDRFIAETPFEVTGVDFDSGSEFINYDVIGWAAELDIYFTRSLPYKKTIKPRSSPRTTRSCADMRSTGATTPSRSCVS